MGTCCGVKSSPSRDELSPLEQKAHEGIEDRLIESYRADNKVKKLLLLGSGSSGKSTIFRQLKCVYKSGFEESDFNEFIPIIRRNLVSAILILLKKTQQLYEMDEKENSDCYIDLDNISESILTAIQSIANFGKEDFADYENLFLSYTQNEDDDDNTIDDNTERLIREKKEYLHILSKSIKSVWSLSQIQNTWNKRTDARVAFCFPDNMDHFFSKIDECFTWNFTPSSDDILKCRTRTTGIVHAYYERKKVAFTITDVGGQRNERKKWIHGFEGVTCVIFLAALNHYGTVLFEDESKNAMIESIELFYETCNLRWFRKTEMILFLNKDDLFRTYIEKNIALADCFCAENGCIYKKEYDDESNYYPKKSAAKSKNKNRTNSMKADRLEDEDDTMMINEDGEAMMDASSYHRQRSKEHLNDDNISKCAIYPKQALRFSAKNSWNNGMFKNESDQKWIEFVYNDYLHFITEQYLSKNKQPELKRYGSLYNQFECMH